MQDESFLDDLQRWVADARDAEAGLARSRARRLREQAGEDATFSSIALDLAERDAELVATSTAGSSHPGRIIAVGRDFVVVWERRGVPTFLPLGAITSLRLPPGERPGDPTGDREPPLDASLGAVLGGLAGDRPRVQVVHVGSAVSGELRAVGADVLLVHVDGHPAVPAYLPLAGLVQLSVLDAR